MFCVTKGKAVLDIISKTKFSALALVHSVISLVDQLYGIYCNCLGFSCPIEKPRYRLAVWVYLLFPTAIKLYHWQLMWLKFAKTNTSTAISIWKSLLISSNHLSIVAIQTEWLIPPNGYEQFPPKTVGMAFIKTRAKLTNIFKVEMVTSTQLKKKKH